MELNRRAHPLNHRGAGYSARIQAFSFTLLIAAGPWLPLFAQENAPVRHTRLVDSIRTSQGLLNIRVDLHRGIVYSLADSGGIIVEIQSGRGRRTVAHAHRDPARFLHHQLTNRHLGYPPRRE